jgi:ABC-type methionine transport system ATPase subunit
MRQLNRDQGTTFVVVTHNPVVARSADRIITLRDGHILSDKRIDNVYLEDLKEVKESALGRAILQGTLPAELPALASALPQLRELLKAA